MAYYANQYNNATPLSSSTRILAQTDYAADKKYLILSDNELDGTYLLAGGEVGLWGTSVSGPDGTLPEPYIFTVEGDTSVGDIRIIGSEYGYPVDFTLDFYLNDALLESIVVTGNADKVANVSLSHPIRVDKYTLTVTKINLQNSIVRLLNLYAPYMIGVDDTLRVGIDDTSDISVLSARSDSCKVTLNESESYVVNHIRSTDEFSIAYDDSSYLKNVHTVMKEPSRHIFAKTYITYTDPMLDALSQFSSSGIAHNSKYEQLSDSIIEIGSQVFFNLYENNLTGQYILSGPNDEVGWSSSAVSDDNGEFAEPVWLMGSFAERPIFGLTLTFDSLREILCVDFDIIFYTSDDNEIIFNYTDNTDYVIEIPDHIGLVKAIKVVVYKVNMPNYPAVILEMPTQSTVLYKGYDDESNLMSIGLLEELTYEDEIEALGGVSANEITVVIDNSNKEFFFNNTKSTISRHLKRNRRIEPWLGVELDPNLIEWYKLGTFWSYKWSVPVQGLTTTVVGFDTIGLLSLTQFTNHYLQINKSIGQLIEYVLDDAALMFNFIEYNIDDELYNIIIPYAWFEPDSHAEALRKISRCFPMHIYCNRDNIICAAPQRLGVDWYVDIWSDDTNVIDKNYSSLYTSLPNIIDVEVKLPGIIYDETAIQDEVIFDVTDIPTRTLNFQAPFHSDLRVTIDKDSSVNYTYAVYSWGVVFNFTGTGKVRSILCAANTLESYDTAVIHYRDEQSILSEGANTRIIQSDFIQTSDIANMIIDRIVGLSEYDKFDAEVQYRGDIALSINDPILLEGGIAPDNRYNIKRHELFWNGALTGSASLNT